MSSNSFTSTDLWLFCFLLLGLFLSFSGNGNFVDENLIIQTVESIVERGELTIYNMFQALEGPDGRYYSRYGIGFPVLMIPFYLIGEWLPSWPVFMGDPNMFVMLTSSLIFTALTGWVFYRICLCFEASPKLAVFLSVALIFATPFWPYSQTLFRLTVSGLVLLLIFWCVLLYLRDAKISSLTWIALSVAFAANLREDLVFAVILIGVFGMYRASGTSKVRLLAAFGIGGITGILIWGVHNYIRFEQFFIENYQDLSFQYPLILSLPELLIGERAGLILYAPVVLFLPLSYFAMKRARMVDLWCLCVSILVVYFLLYGKSNFWHGGSCYGPRHMYFFVPFACLPAVWFLQDSKIWKQLFLGLCVAMGIMMNWPGIYAHQGRYPSFFRSPSFFEILWRPLGHPIYNQETDIDMWWIRMIKLDLYSLWPVFFLLAIGLFVCVGYRLWKSAGEQMTHTESLEKNCL